MRTLRPKPPRPPRKDKNKQGCCEPGCTGEHKAFGRCLRHYAAWKRSLLPPSPPRPSFYNPLVPKVEEMALTLAPRIIVSILGLTTGTVNGIIWRARQMGRLRDPKDPPVYVPTPDRFPRKGCCLYMEGDPKNPASTFCGKPAFVREGEALDGASWCAQHRKIVYYKPMLSNLALEQIRVLVIPEAAD